MTWKDQIAPKESFSQKTTKKSFIYLLVPFFWVKLIKNLRADSKWRGHHTIFVPKWPNCSEYNNISFRKAVNIISMSLLALFIVQNCKTILTADPGLRDRVWHSGS